MSVTAQIKKTVCIIVDNPLRDLDGCVLIAWHLIKQNVEVCLVPMYHWPEVFLIRPDFVLVNFLRPANQDKIRLCQKLKIQVGVLDTEGGVLQDVDDYYDKVFIVDQIDLYCFWGEKQYLSVKKHKIFSDECLSVTGCPRYDFYAEPWRKAIQNCPVDKPFILVNTNFTLSQPRFQSRERELEELIEFKNNKDSEKVVARANEYQSGFEQMVEAIEKLASKYVQLMFVLRPHPFEDRQGYENIFQKYKNVEVHQSGPVFPWINNCILLLHQNCSTAIEATMSGKEPIHFDYFNTPLLEQSSSIAVSHRIGSYQEVENLVEKCIEGTPPFVKDNLKQRRDNIIKTWLFANDGKSSERVAKKIQEKINNRLSKTLSLFQYYLIYILLPLRQKGMKQFIVHLLYFFIGTHHYLFIKNIIKKMIGRKVTTAKDFSVNDVERIIERLDRVDINTKYPKASEYTKNSVFDKSVRYKTVVISFD